jgi:predicted O-methyltransferase YrrM
VSVALVGSRRERLRAHRQQLYGAGHVPDESGEPVSLHPHSLPQVDADGVCALAESEGVRSTLEVGAGLGMGTLAVCEALLAVGAADARNTLVDPNAFGGDAGVRTVREAGVEDLVERVRERSQIALPRLLSDRREFDFALVDGGHRFEDVFLDLVYAGELLRPSAVLVVDDLWMPAIRLAVSYLERNLGYVLEPDLHPDGFRWRRRLPGRQSWTGVVAVLRKPAVAPELAWDGFVPFTSV